MSPAAFAIHSICTGNNQNLNMISEQRAMVIHFTVAAMSVIKGGWGTLLWLMPDSMSVSFQSQTVWRADVSLASWPFAAPTEREGQTWGNALTSGLRTAGRPQRQLQPTAQICSRITLIRSAQPLIETQGVMPSISSSQKCNVRIWNGSGWHSEWKLTTKENMRLCHESTSLLVRGSRKKLAEILDRWVDERLGTHFVFPQRPNVTGPNRVYRSSGF